MPINPNIALGAQPQQPVNFLGQMGQAMALRAASQDIEGNEALRNFYSSGGNAATPEGARALMAANPKMGMQILKGQSEMSARDIETQTKSLKSIKDNVGPVNSQEGMIEYLKGAYNTPGGALLAKLVPLDKAIAAIPSDPKALAEYKRNFGSTADRLFESADAQLSSRTSFATAGMTAQTAANRLGFDERKFKFEQENPGFEYKTLDNGSIAAVNKRTNAITILQTPGAAPAAGATPPINALTPPSAAPTSAASLNSLINPPVVNQPGAPTRANAAALPTTPLRAAPRPGYEYNAQGQQVPIKDPAAVVSTVTDAQGTVRGLNYKGDVVSTTKGVGKPSAFVEKTTEAKAQLDKDLETAIRNLTDAIKPGGLLEQSTASGIGRAYDAGAAFVGRATEGAVAAAQLAPIADLVLKMVPRFEGPQGVKDVESYERAAGQLANASLPVETRRGAAKVILKLMTERKNQFVMKGQEGSSGTSPANTGDIATDPAIQSLLNKYK
jgi:hypothetical protein